MSISNRPIRQRLIMLIMVTMLLAASERPPMDTVKRRYSCLGMEARFNPRHMVCKV